MRRLAPIVLASTLVLLLAGAAAGQTAVVGARDDGSAGYLVGRVCADRDGDGVCGADEPGLAQARVVLSDGSFATTDSEGRYHLAGLPPRRAELRSDGRVLEAYGRVLVKLDLASLGRGASVARARHVVEVGPAALQALDFPVRFDAAPQIEPLAPSPERGPRGVVRGGALLFRVAGQVPEGHRVRVAGREVQVVEGRFRQDVELQAGANVFGLTVLSPGGDLAFYRQRVAAVRRERGGVLFIPSAPERLARLQLPDPRGAPAAEVSVALAGLPGVQVEVGTASRARATIAPDGQGTVQLTLARGEQRLEVRVRAGEERYSDTVPLRGDGRSWASALLSLELGFDLGRKELSLLGRGTANVQQALGEWDLAAGLDLDVGDVLAAAGRVEGSDAAADPEVLLRPRALSFERVLDPRLYPPVTGDDGTAGSANPAGGRLWARVQHARFGALTLGSVRASLDGAEVGRYHRALFGGLLDARAPLGPVTLRAQAFGAPPASPLGEAQAAPAHDEQWGTGGSLYFLRHAQVLPGSEAVRVEVRDGLTGLPLEERALVRHQDYELDYESGRLLLAAPLPMAVGSGPLLGTPLQAHRPVLLVDYQFQTYDGARAQVLGGGAGVQVGRWLELRGGAVKEHRLDAAEGEADYRLLAAHARSRLGPVTLTAELAHSQGVLLPEPGAYSLSDTGGLTAVSPSLGQGPAGGALAYAVRASASEEGWGGQIYARGREAGFSDAGSASAAAARQFGGLARVQLGRFELAGRFDDRRGADPRDPLGAAEVGARDGALRLTGRFQALQVTAEGTFASLEAPEVVGAEVADGGRVGLGLRLDYRVVPELSINASHHQRLFAYGEGAGALDDTFAAVGASWRPRDELGFSARGGWGPGVGTQIQAGVERADQGEVAYGLWTTDVDGPNAGLAAAVSGARRRVDEEAEVYAEDLFARDVDALRTARAVGLRLAPARGLNLSVRYERGARLPFTGGPALLRDVGSGRAAAAFGSLRVGVLAEVRRERGEALTEVGVERWQTVGGLTAEVRPARYLTLGGRLFATKTRNRGVDEDTTVEGYGAVALRLSPWVVLASYSVVDRTRPGAGPVVQHVVALRPAVLLFDRLRVGAGLYAGFYRGDQDSDVLAVSLRPAVRIVGGLEVAAEVGRRSSAPAGESLDAVRVEVAYWFQEVVGVALGYNLHGYSGAGVEQESGHSDRVYLRLEAAY